MTITLAATAPAGHDSTCSCVPCLNADLDQHILKLGGEALLARVNADPASRAKIAAERTRYAKPGTRAGRGVVRLVSAKQVKYIQHLLATRDTTNLVRLPGSEDVAKMSLTGARDLIDRLLNCPEKKGPAVMTGTDLATAKQVDYALFLSERKGVPAPAREVVERFTRAQISQVIDQLQSRPDAPKAQQAGDRIAAKVAAKAQTRVTEDGMYRTPDGDIFKVQIAKQGSGNLYAKKLVLDEESKSGSFEYAPGAINTLRAEWKMSLEEAKEFGKLYGVCCKCGRELTDETSIAEGIGPICAGKF